MLKNISFYEQVFDVVPDSIILHDAGGRILYVNQSACRSQGRSRSDLLEMNFSDLFTPECAGIYPGHLQDLMAAGEAFFESANLCRDGSVINVEIQERLITLDDQKYILSIIRDITRQKQIFDQITNERNKYQSFISSLDCGMAIMDLDFNIVSQNTYMTAIYGDCQGKKCYECYENNPQVCEGCPVTLSMEDGRPIPRNASRPPVRGNELV
jgi:PAS domain S-box-containing protein